MRMAGTHTIREADAVMDLAYNIVGTDGIYRDRDFQRRYQDMRVITQHMQGRLTHYPRLGQYGREVVRLRGITGNYAGHCELTLVCD